jgi:alpha-glucosidase (family GH31 glycosyl hydrolase)
MATSAPLTIVHRPTGIDHPYEPFFDERRPRDPCAGDMVVLGFLTTPGRLARDVRVDWIRNGRRQTPIYARALERGDDADRWLVELGVVEAGDSVDYRITATGAENATIESLTHRFVTRAWHTATHTEPAASGVLLTDDQDGTQLPLVVEAATDALRLALASPDEAHGHAMHHASAEQAPHPSVPDRAGSGPALRPVGAATDGSITLGRDDREPLPISIRWQEEGGRITAIELTWPLAPGEAICGLGERFDALDQRGRAVDTTVYEQYKNQGNRTYLPVPFLLSSEGYALLVEGTAAVDLDLGRTVPDHVRCVASVPASGAFAVRFFAGGPDEVVRSLTAATGRPAPIPAWAYGVWMSSNEWNTQARVEWEVAETRRHEIAATVMVIEAWSDESTFYVWNGAEYAPRDGGDHPRLADFTFPADGPWPDPAGMTRALHDAGLRLVIWQIPALKALDDLHPQHDADIAHALDHAYVLRNDDGTPYRNPFFWFQDAHIPDFTSDAATAWWLAKRRYLLDEVGVDGFKTDGGEHLAGRGLRASDGRRGDELVNAYPNLYVGAHHRFATARRGGDAVTFSRAGYTGAGALPSHWAGDENSTWEAYRRSIVAGLTAGLSGVVFWGWDLAGFSDDLPTAELYLRSAAMAAFCPIMQYHSEYNPSGPSRDRTPWNIAAVTGDERAISLFRHFARVRMNLLPYLVAEGAYAAEQGTPLMRPLLLDWPDDPTCWRIADQYTLGRSLLVAPVVEEAAAARTLYLPGGDWVDLWNKEGYAGGQWLTVDAPWNRIPVFARAGATIPLRLGDTDWLGGDPGNGVGIEDGITRWLAGS